MANDFSDAFANANYDFSELPKATANISSNDKQISGGRTIVDYKSNQLFTGQFEKVDLDAFQEIWNRYKINNKTVLKPLLLRQAKAMIHNYMGAVSPIEVMLYTSNVVATGFANRKLINDVAEVVYQIFKENENFFKSIEHILKVWKWNQAINVCEIAAGKIAADRNSEEDIELLRYIYSEYHYMDEVNYGCFCALMESKNEEFVTDILEMIHGLTGTETDKQIANVFKRNFGTFFPNYHNSLDGSIFKDSSSFVQELIKKMVDPKLLKNMTGKFKEAFGAKEKQYWIQKALDVIINNTKEASAFDAINVLRFASDETISKQLFEKLNLKSPYAQRSQFVTTVIIAKYFGKINYPPAIKAFEEIPPSHDYYAAARVALYFQGRIGSNEIVRDFLSETKPSQIKTYLDGFFDLQENIPSVRESIFNYLSGNLSEEQLSNAITNYYQLVQKYRQLYIPQVGETLIQKWFGFIGTIWNTVLLSLQDQMICLNIIGMIIDDRNYTKYEKFLYYVAEEGINFQASVSQRAKNILKTLNIAGIRA